MRALIAVAVTLALAPAAAASMTLEGPRGLAPRQPAWQQWLDASRIPLPDYTLHVDYDNPDLSTRVAYFIADDPDHVLHVPRWVELDRHELLHEACHVTDYVELRDADRTAIMRLLSGATEWRNYSPVSPHEQFAEACALVAQFRRWPRDGQPDNVAIGYGVQLTRRTFNTLRIWLTNIPVRNRLVP